MGQSHPVTLVAGTRAAALYGVTESVEEFWCNYGVNPEYRARLEAGGLTLSGFGEDGEIRAVELADHPFFIATLYLPQKRSSPGLPHPVLAGFAAAVGSRRSDER